MAENVQEDSHWKQNTRGISRTRSHKKLTRTDSTSNRTHWHRGLGAQSLNTQGKVEDGWDTWGAGADNDRARRHENSKETEPKRGTGRAETPGKGHQNKPKFSRNKRVHQSLYGLHRGLEFLRAESWQIWWRPKQSSCLQQSISNTFNTPQLYVQPVALLPSGQK